MGDYTQALVFRLNDHGQGPELLRQVFLERGWTEFDEDEQEDHDWNMWWRTSRFRASDHEQLQPWQRLNHYPKSTAITKKDSLARNLKRMKSVHGTVYNFSPIAFNLPNDYTKFVSEYSQSKDKGHQYWICKPADLSRGRGIFVFKDLSELQYDFSAVVQQYVPNPLLISGYKFDIRIYVMVSSFTPLNIHIYNEGLVRFSTEKYDLTTLKNVFSHLTNTSINKNSPSYSTDKERIGPGCKWTLTQLRHYIHQIGIDDTTLFGKIINIIILTLLVQAQQVPKVFNCFELYGFDVLIDSNWKPWLLEVNFSPALSCDCQTDIFVKKPLLNDLCDLLRFSENDKERGGEEYQIQRNQAIQLKNTMYTSYIPAPAGGRRSSLGGNMSNNRKPPLAKRGSSNKLPSIANQGNSCLLAGTPRSVNSMAVSEQEEEDVITHKPPISEHRVIKLIPGCGLPSVQQPYSMADPLATDSGNSSQESDCEDSSNNNENTRQGDDKVYAVRRSKKDIIANDDEKRKPTNASVYAKQYKSTQSLYNNNNNSTGKRSSKASTTSDSGVSSHSGSSHSESCHTPTKLKEHNQLTSSLQNMSYSHKSSQERVNSRLNHIDYKEGISLKEAACDGKSKQEVGNRAVASIGNIKYQQEDNDESPSGTVGQKYGTNRKGERLSRLSRDFRNPRKYQGSFNASSHVQPKARGPVVRSQSQLSNFQMQHQIITPRNNRDKHSNYSRPWRKTQPNQEKEKSSAPKISPYNPEKVVGGFHLVFPFNDVTKRCAQGSLDPKIVIKECQKLLKERITQAQERKKQKSTRTETKENSSIEEKAPSARSHRSYGSLHLSHQGSEKTSVTSHSSSTLNSRPNTSSPTRGDGVASAKSNIRSSVSTSRSNSKTGLKSSSIVNSTRSSPSLHVGGAKSETSAVKVAPSFSSNQFDQEPQELWGPLKHVPKEPSF